MAKETSTSIKNNQNKFMSAGLTPIEETQCRALAVRNAYDNLIRSEDRCSKSQTRSVQLQSKAFLALERKLQARMKNKYACPDDELQPTSKMLIKMFNWLSTVCWSYDVDSDGLFLCVQLVNSFLESHSVNKSKLQALGVVSLLLSCKYTGQQKRFTIQEISGICKNIYSAEELLEFEAKILETIDYDLEQPHTFRFLKEYIGESNPLSDEQYAKVCFWLQVQILLHDNHQKYSKRDILTSVIEFVTGNEHAARQTSCPIINSLLKVLRATSYKTVCHKYESKFDTEIYLKRFGVEYS